MAVQGQTEVATRTTWQFDPAHTLVEFSAKHMMFTTVKGHFKTIQGSIVFDEKNPAQSSVEVTINASSLYSGMEKRDEHLRSSDFLDVEKYPTLTFKSTKVELVDDAHAKVIGDLTIRGVTREVVLDTEITGHGMSPMKK